MDRFTKEELDRLQRQFSLLSEDHLVQVYKDAHETCKLTDRLPCPSAMQELVAAWKQLWKWRRRA